MSDLQSWNDLLKAKQTLFILDACFSGLSGVTKKAGSLDLKIEQLSQNSYHILAAGTSTEKAIVHERWQGSLFTDSIIEGLSGKADTRHEDYPADGVISLYELVEYVQGRVITETHSIGWDGQLTPDIRVL